MALGHGSLGSLHWLWTSSEMAFSLILQYQDPAGKTHSFIFLTMKAVRSVPFLHYIYLINSYCIFLDLRPGIRIYVLNLISSQIPLGTDVHGRYATCLLQILLSMPCSSFECQHFLVSLILCAFWCLHFWVLQLKRRKVLWALYLMRDPFFTKYTR